MLTVSDIREPLEDVAWGVRRRAESCGRLVSHSIRAVARRMLLYPMLSATARLASDTPHDREAVAQRSPSHPLAGWKGSVAQQPRGQDRKSTRLNSSHQIISYAVFCLKKKYNVKPMD